MPGKCVRKRYFMLMSMYFALIFGVFECQYLENEARAVWISFHFQVYHFKLHQYFDTDHSKVVLFVCVEA